MLFDLSFSLNSDLQPSLEELEQFLGSPLGNASARKHRDDFTYYLRDTKAVEDFMSSSRGEYNLDEQKLLGVLSHSQFFNPSIKFAIELYKYHLSKLRMLDFKKPHAFVRAVQEEIATLNPKRRADKKKIADLQARLDKRNEDIDALEKIRIERTLELKNIALYVRDFLSKIQKLCEYSIAALLDSQLGKNMDLEMIEDLKNQFKGEIREQMLLGPVSFEEAKRKKADFLEHSQELSQLVLQDRHSLRGLYEQILAHARKYAIKLDAPVRKIEAKKGLHFEEERNILGTIEEELVSLISDYRFVTKKTGQIVHKDEHIGLIMDKRKEMMYRLLNFLLEHAIEVEKRGTLHIAHPPL